MFISLWEFFYGHFFRFWMKWLLRQMTGKCELQRIFDTYVGAQRTHRIGNVIQKRILKTNEILIVNEYFFSIRIVTDALIVYPDQLP